MIIDICNKFSRGLTGPKMFFKYIFVNSCLFLLKVLLLKVENVELDHKKIF